MAQTSLQRFPFGRVILCTIGTGLLLICIFCAMDYVRMSRQLEAARTARMGEVQVDLSKAGQTRVPAKFEFAAAHGISLLLTGASEASLKELKARVAVAANDDRELEWRDVNLEYCRWIGNEVELYRTMGAPRDFAFVLDVQQPALAMAGQGQKLYAKYELCGLEDLAVTISGAFVIGAGVLSASILGGVVHYTRKHRIGAKQPELPQQV